MHLPTLTLTTLLPLTTTSPLTLRQFLTPDCGFVTDATTTYNYPLTTDPTTCHSLNAHGAAIKTYYVRAGCICMFYANDRCSVKPVEEWTGWVFGEAGGEFTKGGTSHYMCAEGMNPWGVVGV